ncbi:hypothetical protein KP509_28G062200 [Ceratopteris richardii]|uniref:Uncharacterized protein n=1 Tax=Ceratopteris richardii TaxID=49495 RepID=A0A8T2RF86_CERRI|nr:hypothetical protein KP509_28G062200 [Ceratopteris richardii]
MMENSAASIFTEANFSCLPLAWSTSAETVEELHDNLMPTAMELQIAREATRSQSRMNEATICQLQLLLDTTRKERDIAIRKCNKLQKCILGFSNSLQTSKVPSTESLDSLLRLSVTAPSSPSQLSHPASPAMDTTAVGKPVRSVCDDKACDLFFEERINARHDCAMMDDIFAQLGPNPGINGVSMADSEQPPFYMDVLNDDLSLHENESLNLNEFEAEKSPKSAWDSPNTSGKSSWSVRGSNDSRNVLMRQSSSISTAGSQAVLESMCFKSSPPDTSRNPATINMSKISIQTAATEAIPQPIMLPNVTHHRCKTPQMKANHVEFSLPESHLSREVALPEKGKLLQAVMQAGPLLQNLLIAGPLPQWRYPPPQLSIMDISKVPMDQNSLPQYVSSPTDMRLGLSNVMPEYPSPIMDSSNPLCQFQHTPLAYFAASVHGSVPHNRFDAGRRNFEARPTHPAHLIPQRKLRRFSPIRVK